MSNKHVHVWAGSCEPSLILMGCVISTSTKFSCAGSLYILREKSLAIYFEDSQLRRNRTFNFIVSILYVDKRSRER